MPAPWKEAHEGPHDPSKASLYLSPPVTEASVLTTKPFLCPTSSSWEKESHYVVLSLLPVIYSYWSWFNLFKYP